MRTETFKHKHVQHQAYDNITCQTRIVSPVLPICFCMPDSVVHRDLIHHSIHTVLKYTANSGIQIQSRDITIEMKGNQGQREQS